MAKWHTPRTIADLLGCKVDTIRSLIRSGAIEAVDVSLKPGGKPRFRISPEAFEDFQLRRRVQQPVKAVRRRRVDQNVTQYF